MKTKKIYLKPTMKVCEIEIRGGLLAGSVRSLSNTDGLNWKDGGFDDNVPDY